MTDKTRLIFFVDVVWPLLFPANIVNWISLNVVLLTPYIEEGYDHRRQ